MNEAEESTMTCAICGKDIPDGTRNCPNCTTPVEPVTPGSLNPAVRIPRRRTALIVAVIILAVLVGGGFLAYQLFGRDIRRLVLGPKKSCLLVESATLKGGIETLAGGVAAFSSQASAPVYGAEGNVSIKLASTLPGISPDLAKAVNSLKLKVTTLFDRQQSGPKAYAREELFTGNDPLLGIELFMAEDQMTIGLPGLIDAYIAVPLDSLTGAGAGGLEVGGLSPKEYLKQGFAPVPQVDKALLAASLNKLADVFLTHIDAATFADNVQMQAGSVSAAYECYTMTTSGRQMRDMAVAMLELTRDEKPLHDLIYPYMRSALLYGSAYGIPMTSSRPDVTGVQGATGTRISEAEWTQQLTRQVDTLKALKDEDLKDITFTQRVYIDKQDRVHGRELSVVKAGSQKQTVTLKVLQPVNGSQYGLLVSLMADSPDLTDHLDVQLTSQYERRDGRLTGTADVVSAGKTAMTTAFRDLDQKPQGGQQYLTGEVDLSLDAKALGSDMAIPKLTLKGEVRSSRYFLDIAAVNLGSVSIDMAAIDAASVKIPSLNGKALIKADDEEALSGLMTTDVQMKLIEILQKLGIDPMTLF